MENAAKAKQLNEMLESMKSKVVPGALLVVKQMVQEDKDGNLVSAALVLSGEYAAAVLEEVNELLDEIMKDIADGEQEHGITDTEQ